MSTLKDIENKALHAVHYGERLRPQRDWFVLLSIAALLVLLSALWNAWVFIRVERGEAVGAPSGAAPVHVENALQKAEQLFTDRALEAARYRSEYQFVDPS